MTRTITHLYDTYDEATRAVSKLEDAGIPQSDISLVGHDGSAAGLAYGQTATAGGGLAEPVTDYGTGIATPTTTTTTTDASEAGSGAGAGASVGTVIGGGLGLLTGIGALAIPGVGPVVAAGWLVATLSGAGIGAGAGGLLGSLVGAGHREEDAHVYAESVRRGGTLVSVRVDDARAAEVESLLGSTGRIDIARRGDEYRAGGWSRFDESAAPVAGHMPGNALTGEPNPATRVGGALPTSTEAADRQRLGAATHT